MGFQHTNNRNNLGYTCLKVVCILKEEYGHFVTVAINQLFLILKPDAPTSDKGAILGRRFS